MEAEGENLMMRANLLGEATTQQLGAPPQVTYVVNRTKENPAATSPPELSTMENKDPPPAH